MNKCYLYVSEDYGAPENGEAFVESFTVRSNYIGKSIQRKIYLKMSRPKYVYVQTTNNIGVILDEGTDNMGNWYRTDCDGVNNRVYK